MCIRRGELNQPAGANTVVENPAAGVLVLAGGLQGRRYDLKHPFGNGVGCIEFTAIGASRLGEAAKTARSERRPFALPIRQLIPVWVDFVHAPTLAAGGAAGKLTEPQPSTKNPGFLIRKPGFFVIHHSYWHVILITVFQVFVDLGAFLVLQYVQIAGERVL
ncbi:MAG: hypothetical protein J0L65_14695 [Xanthomonadales bacterium]|nr:hypothetical protein [Xanthomonadales bacterium]